MDQHETRVRTRNGVLVVTDDHVRLERGPVLRRTTKQIPRGSLTRVRLTSRFHAAGVVIGILLLAASVALTVATATVAAMFQAPVSLLTSLALVLVVTGLLCMLALPLSWRAILEVAAGQKRIRVYTGFRKRPQLEAALARLHERPPDRSELTRLNETGRPSKRASIRMRPG